MKRLCLVAERANRMIAAECRAYPYVETGGALQGEITKRAVAVLFSAPGGPRSHRSASMFRPSASYQQPYIDFLFERFGVNFVGDWHKHPSHMPFPSATDLATACTIVTSKRWDMSEAVFPIATVTGGKVSLRAFFITRDTLAFEELPVVIVPDSDPQIAALLTGQTSERKEDQHESSNRCLGSPPGRTLVRRLAARLRTTARR